MHVIMKTAGQRLTETQQQFARWRQGCRRPGRIPTELWMLAAEDVAEPGVEQTAQTLQLSPERLERWCQQLGLTSQSAKTEGMQFLQLSPMPINSRFSWPAATPRRPAVHRSRVPFACRSKAWQIGCRRRDHGTKPHVIREQQ